MVVNKLDRNLVNAGRRGVQDADTVISALANEVERLEAGMAEAVRIIREAKREFAPTTTNSIADDFLRRWDT